MTLGTANNAPVHNLEIIESSVRVLLLTPSEDDGKLGRIAEALRANLEQRKDLVCRSSISAVSFDVTVADGIECGVHRAISACHTGEHELFIIVFLPIAREEAAGAARVLDVVASYGSIYGVHIVNCSEPESYQPVGSMNVSAFVGRCETCTLNPTLTPSARLWFELLADPDSCTALPNSPRCG